MVGAPEIRVVCGDSRIELQMLADDSLDACVTDPPYALVSIGKRFGAEGAAPAKGGVYARASAGFMGQRWDTGETAFSAEFWGDVYRVLKPGANLVAFGGTRTYHRLACAIEDAGFEIRDMIAWLYGSGFPKSHNQGEGRGTALKPALEPVVLARKPLIGTVRANLEAFATGALNIDACRIETEDTLVGSGSPPLRFGGDNARPFHDVPQSRGSNPSALGRWPANVVHDGSDEVVSGFPTSAGQKAVVRGDEPSHSTRGVYNPWTGRAGAAPRWDEGSAARFFYSSKADANDRIGSKHPTVKPVDLMRWLVRLVTPPGGVVLDPFAGSGTTGEACLLEGFGCVLIEREAKYVEDINRRLAAARGDISRAAAKAVRHAPEKLRGEDAPLFAGRGG